MILVDIQPSTTSIIIGMLDTWDRQKTTATNNNKRSKNHKSQAGGIAQSSVRLENSLVLHVGLSKVGKKIPKDPIQRGIKLKPFPTALDEEVVIGRLHTRVKRGCRSGQYPFGPEIIRRTLPRSNESVGERKNKGEEKMKLQLRAGVCIYISTNNDRQPGRHGHYVCALTLEWRGKGIRTFVDRPSLDGCR